MRRSELVALEVDDVTFAEDGSGTVLVCRSKADQAGEGAVVYIAPDTVDLVKAWGADAVVDEGPLFRRVSKGAASAIACPTRPSRSPSSAWPTSPGSRSTRPDTRPASAPRRT